jgi:heme-degrading monooxygenase HmoA
VFIFYSVHYPAPGKETQLAESMHQYGEVMKRQPGLIFVAPYPFKDPEKGTLMGISIWDSEESFQTALPALQEARKDAPSREWESRPTEVYMLHSVL